MGFTEYWSCWPWRFRTLAGTSLITKYLIPFPQCNTCSTDKHTKLILFLPFFSLSKPLMPRLCMAKLCDSLSPHVGLGQDREKSLFVKSSSSVDLSAAAPQLLLACCCYVYQWNKLTNFFSFSLSLLSNLNSHIVYYFSSWSAIQELGSIDFFTLFIHRTWRRWWCFWAQRVPKWRKV